ncbi:GAF domain-containing protein [Paenibacillus sp. JX-17]|uniref:GAF domain-containing protein n=1 Tax=Paenibacillus lacisoli TaxID=3064525 RepID=A0ABT9CFW7_9BACL|nr:GAF domain-containing protein [Paenibacillus sp. JX-17]MDO7906837.1 GAF domain-containing protein [Paenibacillus sp. JX-17]
MPELPAEIQREIDLVCTDSRSDIAGVALAALPEGKVGWLYVSGSRNGRYRRIIVKPGRGIAGLTLRSGRPVKLDDAEPDLAKLRQNSPLMLAEQLHAAMAVPLRSADGQAVGVLMVGRRSPHVYTPEDLKSAESAAAKLRSLLLAEPSV